MLFGGYTCTCTCKYPKTLIVNTCIFGPAVLLGVTCKARESLLHSIESHASECELVGGRHRRHHKCVCRTKSTCNILFLSPQHSTHMHTHTCTHTHSLPICSSHSSTCSSSSLHHLLMVPPSTPSLVHPRAWLIYRYVSFCVWPGLECFITVYPPHTSPVVGPAGPGGAHGGVCALDAPHEAHLHHHPAEIGVLMVWGLDMVPYKAKNRDQYYRHGNLFLVHFKPHCPP